MLIGRFPELGALERLVRSVTSGLSAAVVLRGEAGAGKTALLDHVAAAAKGVAIVRLSGLESETHLDFAAIHRLLVPYLAQVDGLPPIQARALRTAIGLSRRGAGELVHPRAVGADDPVPGHPPPADAGDRGRRAVAGPGVARDPRFRRPSAACRAARDAVQRPGAVRPAPAGGDPHPAGRGAARDGGGGPAAAPGPRPDGPPGGPADRREDSGQPAGHRRGQPRPEHVPHPAQPAARRSAADERTARPALPPPDRRAAGGLPAVAAPRGRASGRGLRPGVECRGEGGARPGGGAAGRRRGAGAGLAPVRVPAPDDQVRGLCRRHHRGPPPRARDPGRPDRRPHRRGPAGLAPRRRVGRPGRERGRCPGTRCARGPFARRLPVRVGLPGPGRAAVARLLATCVPVAERGRGGPDRRCPAAGAGSAGGGPAGRRRSVPARATEEAAGQRAAPGRPARPRPRRRPCSRPPRSSPRSTSRWPARRCWRRWSRPSSAAG